MRDKDRSSRTVCEWVCVCIRAYRCSVCVWYLCMWMCAVVRVAYLYICEYVHTYICWDKHVVREEMTSGNLGLLLSAL